MKQEWKGMIQKGDWKRQKQGEQTHQPPEKTRSRFEEMV